MPVFTFVAINEAGREYTGREEAVSESALEGRLRKMGHWVADLKEVRTMRRARGLGARGGKRVPSRLLTEFFLQLSMQLRAGIPLFNALSNETVDSGSPAMRQVVIDLTERVQAGQSLSEAMSCHPRVFSRLVVNILKAGEASGRLAESCQQVRRYLEWQDKMMGDVKQALVYPCFILIAALLFVLLVFTFVIPRFGKLLAEMNVPLPTVTQIVMDISQFFVQRWLVVIVFVFGAVAAYSAAVRHWKGFAYFTDVVKLKIPIVGRLYHMIGLSRFAQNLSIVYTSGIPLLEALALVGELVGNHVLERAVGDLRKAVSEGKQMHTAMSAHPVFSRLVIQMVAVGETTGSLGTALDNVAQYYDEMLPRLVKRMFSLFEPLMILGLVVFIGGIAMAVFLPIVSLITVR
ncbi:MAG: type II secretion system F family protein [Verrucomicrobia bacterium]|nr:type II secretion system F family protein [Verrucomicrobiota bacterium]